MNAALLLTALFNGAWQGAVLCTLALFAFRVFRSLNATTMFTVWSVLLAIAVLLPAANYAFAPRPMVVVSAPLHYARAGSIPHHDEQIARDNAPVPQHSAAVAAKIDTAVMVSSVLRYARWILLLVALVSVLRLAVLARDIVRMLLARKRVRLIDEPVNIEGFIEREFGYAASEDFTSPCVLGFSPPLIVIPEDLLWEQNARLKSVVLHEREHVRRFDDVQNVLQRFIGAIAFFCPGVRIALRELALYREQICDDAAINATGDRVSYATTLTDLSQWAQGRGAPVPSFIFKRKQLLHRLEVLLDSAVSHSLRMNRRFAFVAAAAVVVAAALVLRIQVPVIAETQTQQQLHQEAAKVRADVKQLHVQTQKLRRQSKAMKADAQQVHAQVVKMHAQLDAVRQQAKVVHTETLQVRSDAKQLKADAAKMRALHVHVHASPDAGSSPLAYSFSAVAVAAAPNAPSVVAVSGSSDLLDALDQAGLRNLSIDDLIAIRDHGVTAMLVRSAVSYFGRINAKDLINLADHGVSSNYLGTLSASGVRGISPNDAITLMNHGVGAPLISAAVSYFSPRPSADDLTYLSDHGVTANCLESFRSAGLSNVPVRDIVRLVDNGVEGGYVAKVRRMMPHASINDIIRLHNAGF